LLNIPPIARAALADGDLMLAAYDHWEEACAERLLGDWSFAAWHPHERRLVLGRDHFGNTSLYYVRAGDRFAFASDARALLSLPWVPRRLNENHLACLLGASLENEGSCTIYRDVHLLLPAHTLVGAPDGRTPRRCSTASVRRFGVAFARICRSAPR
jgi:asparagine synthase (glutamine-hydrolysing)